MESVDRYDRYLDPPDYMIRSECDICHVEFDTEDLSHIDDKWICAECERRSDEK